MTIFYIILFLYLTPLLAVYFLLYVATSIFIAGEKNPGTGQEIYVVSDLIHSDYVFKSEQIKDLFQTDKKFVKVGWGDKKIFLETKRWSDLKIIHFLGALFGINETALRVEYLDELPAGSKKIELNEKQIQIINVYIKDSFYGEPIKKKPSYYQKGDYYRSRLRYNCITNCNNWVNYGLYLAKVTNVIWCPFSFLV